jgi:hypothetical protein
MGRGASREEAETILSPRHLQARPVFESMFAEAYEGRDIPALLLRACQVLMHVGGDAELVGERLYVYSSVPGELSVALRLVILGAVSDRRLFDWTLWNRAPGLSVADFERLSDCAAGAVAFAVNGGDPRRLPESIYTLETIAVSLGFERMFKRPT